MSLPQESVKTAQPRIQLLNLASLDRKAKNATGRKEPAKTSRAERTYARQLESVAKHTGELIAGFAPRELSLVPTLQALLARYAEALTPWAERTAAKMLADIDAGDRESWRALGNSISAGLRRAILSTPVGDRMRSLLSDQVSLIKSIPIDAGQRVHDLTLKALEDSTRAREIAREIERSTEVTRSRATLIARTEVSRTASVLTQARSQYVGSTQYIWRTSRDGTVRPGHRAMEGKACEWANPPAVDEGGRIMHFHPGQIWNCRCWPEPIISDS